MTKPALHASMLSMLSKCGQMAYYRYVEGLKSPPGVAMVIGKAVDLAGNANALHKMAHGDGAPLEEVQDAAASYFEAAWEGEEPVLDSEERAKGSTAVKGESKDASVGLATLEATELLPTIQPISVQKARRLVLPDFDFDLEGATDFEQEETLDDRKCVGKSPPEDRAVGDVQLDFYSLLRAHVDKKPVKHVRIHSLVKNKKPKLVTRSAPAQTDFSALLRRIEAAGKVFQTGAYYPVDPQGPSGWVCSAAYCGWWDSVCPYGRRGRVSVPMSSKE